MESPVFTKLTNSYCHTCNCMESSRANITVSLMAKGAIVRKSSAACLQLSTIFPKLLKFDYTIQMNTARKFGLDAQGLILNFV